MKTWLLIPLMAGALGAMLAPPADLRVAPDKENVVGSRLEGDWRVDAPLTKHLTGKEESRQFGGRLSFKADSTVAARIPAPAAEFLADKTIYLAGIVTFGGEAATEHPFLLIEHRGNPHVVYFRERDGDPMGDAESFNVMLAVARERQNDLLLVGADFNNEPFRAYARVTAESED